MLLHRYCCCSFDQKLSCFLFVTTLAATFAKTSNIEACHHFHQGLRYNLLQKPPSNISKYIHFFLSHKVRTRNDNEIPRKMKMLDKPMGTKLCGLTVLMTRLANWHSNTETTQAVQRSCLCIASMIDHIFTELFNISKMS